MSAVSGLSPLVEHFDPARSDTALVTAWCSVLTEEDERSDAGRCGPLAQQLQAESASRGRHRWVVRRGPAVLGVAELTPQGSGRGLLRLQVAAAHRSRGIGHALLRQVVADLPDAAISHLRAVVTLDTPGARFSAGLQPAVLLRLVVERQHLAEVDLTRLPTAEESDVKVRLVRWRAAPDALIDSYAHTKRAIHDAPGSRYQGLPDRYTPSRVRQTETELCSRAAELWVSAAVCEDTVVGFTEVEVSPGPHASQQDTVVLRTHRGRGLAVLMKADLARWLVQERPDVQTITTSVNEMNVAMRTVNRRLGYRPVRVRLLVEADVATLARRLFG